ncbi:NAD-specific glutamate dehydrogenase [Pseudomonas sp. IT-194MI4]
MFDQWFGAERYAQPGNRQHRQVVGTVTDGNSLLQTQTFFMRQLTQQIRLALCIDNRLDRHAGDLAIDHFQFVGEHIVDAQLGLQLLGEVSEAARQNRGLVAQALEFGEQGFGALGQAQGSTDGVQHADVQPLQQGQALLEAGAEVQLAGHRPLSNRGHLVANAGGLGQFVDDLGFNQRRVHVEHRQTTVTAEQRIFLEGDVDVQLLRNAEEFSPQRLRVSRFATHGKLDATLALVGRGVQRHAAGQTVDMVDVQTVFGGDRTHTLQLLGGHFAGQQGDDVAFLALVADPLLVILFGHRRETHLLLKLIAFEQDVFEHRVALLGVRNFNQDAERQGVVDHRLTDVENVHTTLGQNAGYGRSQTRTVDSRDVYQDDFAQGAPPQVEKNRILPIFSDHRAPRAL